MNENAIDFLKENVDFKELLQHYNAKSIFEMSTQIRCCCPIHGGNNRTAFVYSKKKKLWFCHTGCKTGGDMFDLVMKLDGLEFTESVQKVAEIFNIDISNMTIEMRTYSALKDTKQWIEFMKNFLEESEFEPYDISVLGDLYSINNYRNFDKTFLNNFGIKYCEENKRIVVPIYFNYVLVGVTMRKTDNHPVKWMHQPADIRTGDILYNYDNIDKNGKPLIVVEGIWDALNYVKYGYQNVVATFGASLKDEQIKLILRSTYDVIMAYDTDKAGIYGTMKAIDELKNKINISIARIPDGKDAGELNETEIINSIENKYTMYEWRSTYGTKNKTTR